MNPAATRAPAIPPCEVGVPVEGCCLLPIPNTSQWEVVCASPSGPAQSSIPTLTEWGGLLFAVLLVGLALRRIRS
ncbi:MAG: hypothetical protein WC969_14900 [Elusimicrobiota bacterium]|jgi:hypothetical protein